MEKNGNSAIWSPGELIYSEGSDSTEAYLIVEGYVNLETSDGFKLNRLGIGEIFGETSLLLGTKRTVTAKACDQKVIANIIPKDYFK
jgi:CRP-like cAMP-binding protein